MRHTKLAIAAGSYTAKNLFSYLLKSTVAKLKVNVCNVLFSVILFCIFFAKEIIFVLSSIMVLVCNITFLKSNMTFVKSIIHIIEWMCYELLYTHVVVLVKIGRVLFSYYMYFLHYWLFAGHRIFALLLLHFKTRNKSLWTKVIITLYK